MPIAFARVCRVDGLGHREAMWSERETATIRPHRQVISVDGIEPVLDVEPKDKAVGTVASQRSCPSRQQALGVRAACRSGLSEVNAPNEMTARHNKPPVVIAGLLRHNVWDPQRVELRSGVHKVGPARVSDDHDGATYEYAPSSRACA